ncbi:MAG: acyl-CoA reductase [Bacteroidetes bacterium]|nr:acyl-CoA reductase [Bacteroidota bacterium]
MQLQERIDLLAQLGEYMESGSASWEQEKQKAFQHNGWFTPEFINLSIKNIVSYFLDKNKLSKWVSNYQLPNERQAPKNIGLVMAGNIPLVGFHDFLCAFISGHRQTIKASSKDEVLIRHLTNKLFSLNPKAKDFISFSEMLKGCDAYIATGSNNSARYFEYYFNIYPHIIRRNRTSVAILDGSETKESMGKLADDVFQYFGLGCRNVTKIYVPENYDFVPLIDSFKKYHYLSEHHKYKNNYDYQLAILILNKQYYLTDGAILITENSSVFSPISMLHFEYYKDSETLYQSLIGNEDIQCLVGKGGIPFGQAQTPRLIDFADGVDTMKFIAEL